MPENGDFATETVSSFKRNGFVFPIQIFSQEEAIFYRKKYDEFVTKYGSGDDPKRRVRGNKIFRVHVIAPWAAQIVRNSKLLAVVKAVLDTSNVLIWSSDLTVKSPNSSECFGWHQDCAYADLGPETKLVTAWVALSNSNESNGCVRMMSGSHRLGVLRHEAVRRTEDKKFVLGQTVCSEDLPETNRDIVRCDNSRDIADSDHVKEVLCQLSPGEASLHAWRTIHSSFPNTSDQPRLGLAIRYMCADTVRQESAVVKDRVSLACGQYSGDSFELEQEPIHEYGKNELAEHKLSMSVEWERRRLSKQRGMLPSHKEKQRILNEVVGSDR